MMRFEFVHVSLLTKKILHLLIGGD